jgi:hypothetical protein
MNCATKAYDYEKVLNLSSDLILRRSALTMTVLEAFIRAVEYCTGPLGLQEAKTPRISR